MDKKKINSIVYKTLENKKKIPKKFKENINRFNFIDSGFLDSMEVFLFILKIEKKFMIKFSNKEISSKKIKTVGNIIDLIIKKTK